MSRIPDLGPRGEGWVALQAVIFVAIAASGLLPPAWDGPLRVATTAVGALFVAAGACLVFLGLRDLGGSLTAMPRPRDDGSLVETASTPEPSPDLRRAVLAGWVGSSARAAGLVSPPRSSPRAEVDA
jgi:hypothetical protein